MTTEISSNTADTAGMSTENADSNVVSDSTVTNGSLSADAGAGSPAASGIDAPAGASANGGATPVVGADGKVSYVPNYKYKAALQEKELDPFFHSLVKDPDSEKKVKELFTKVDAFDFVKGKKEEVETKFSSLLNDYDHMSDTVTRFNTSVEKGDLSSAFRLAGISKEKIFDWTRQQIQLMEMPAEQRAQYEQFETAQNQKYELEQKVSSLEQRYQQQAVQARTMQLDAAISRPEVATFAQAWDQNSEPGAFRNFVAEEARKVFYESQQDLSPEQAVAMVMQKFGRFVGGTTLQSPQAIQGNGQRQAPPVIPNVTGKASSPIKKVPRNLDDLKKLAREMRD